MMKFNPITLLALLFCVFVGCSLSNPAKVDAHRTGEYKVSVQSGGREVEDFQQSLIHRLSLSPSEVARIFVHPKKILLPFDSRAETDTRGKTKGLRLIAARGTPGVLGLQANDLLTAIGRTHVTSVEDLWTIRKDLETSSTASLTLERAGKAHKIIYSLGM